MTDKEYDDLKYRIEKIGGHWRERFGGFIFDENPIPALRDIKTWKKYGQSEYVKWQILRQFYPTPNELAEYVVKLGEIDDSHTVLEPSAGKGALLKPLGRTKNVTAVEIDTNLANELQAMGYNVINKSFEDAIIDGDLGTFDRIIMNPPFGPGQKDIKHISKAYSLLKPGGILVGIMSENSLYYKTVLTKSFNHFLKSVGAHIEETPMRSFLQSGTRVDTVIIKITKQE
jgi:predicted RNA methylase